MAKGMFPLKRGGILKEVSALPSGYINDGVFGHTINGKHYIRIKDGPVTAQEAGIFSTGDMTSRINYVMALSKLTHIIIHVEGGGSITIAGTVTIPEGKHLHFTPGSMLSTTGSGVVNGGIIHTDNYTQIFTGTKNFNPEGFSEGVIPAAAWGFLPDTGEDMTPSLQKAVNWGIDSTTTKKVVIAAIGTYLVHNLLILKYSGGNAIQCSVSIEAISPSLNGGVVFRNQNVNAATIHIQIGYGIDINNIIFEGIGPDVSNYVTATDADWRAAVGGGTIRGNQKSPGQTAVSIDNFLNESVGQSTIDSSADYYPDLSTYYTNTVTGGSTNINFNGCTFSRMYVGILEGVSGAANGEGIHVKGGFGIYVAYFWVAGQLQSRENTISGLYSIFHHTFVTNLWGTGVGDIPYVAGNINYVKYLSRTAGNFTFPRFKVYGEGIYTLGIHGGSTPMTYEGCNITRMQNNYFSGVVMGQAPVFLESAGIVKFSDSILMGGDYSAGIPFNCQKLELDNVYLEGGLPFNTNPATYLDNIVFKGVHNFFGGGGANRRLDEGRNEVILDAGMYSNVTQTYFFPGDKFKDLAARTFEMVGDKFDKIPVNVSLSVGNVVTVNNTTKTLTFPAPNAGLFNAGDIIYTDTSINNTADDMAASGTTLGYVTGVSGGTVTLSHIPAGVTNGATYMMYILRIPRFVNHTLGTVTSGSNSITNVIADTGGFVIGDRIKGAGIIPGTYVTNVSGSTITISTNATATADLVELSDAKMKVTADNVPFTYFGGEYNYDNLEVIWFRGDEIRNVTGLNNRGKYCVTPGKVLSANPPVWYEEDQMNFLGYEGVKPRLRIGSFNVQSFGANAGGLAENIYYNGTNWVRREAGFGNVVYFENGKIQFIAAGTGAAGSTATLVTLMELAAGVGPKINTLTGVGTAPLEILADGTIQRGTAGGGGGGLDLELADTYADITASTTPRWIRVATDENNNGDISLYLHNGTTLELVQTLV